MFVCVRVYICRHLHVFLLHMNSIFFCFLLLLDDSGEYNFIFAGTVLNFCIDTRDSSSVEREWEVAIFGTILKFRLGITGRMWRMHSMHVPTNATILHTDYCCL